MRVACVGVGTIGRSWALLFAWKGCDVTIYDVNSSIMDSAIREIREWLTFLIQNKVVEKEQFDTIVSRITPTKSLEDAVRNVDYVQESIVENLELKKQVFKNLSQVAKSSTILASSSSGLSISEIQKSALKPERCLIVHPINPPHLIPLVEIVPGKETSEEVVKEVYNFMLNLGKVPIIVRKEVPGFIFNRLAAALWREALDLVDKDVASVEDIDKAVYSGLGLRFAVMGPFLTYQLGGGAGGLEYFIEHLGPAFSAWWKSMENWSSIPYSAAKKAINGVKQMPLVKSKTYNELVKWRDERLIKMLKAFWHY